MKKFFVALATFALLGCKVEKTTTAEPDTCGAQPLQTLVGQPETVLETMTFANTVRVIHPDTAVTMDYLADRLNINIDAGGKITAVHCG